MSRAWRRCPPRALGRYRAIEVQAARWRGAGALVGVVARRARRREGVLVPRLAWRGRGSGDAAVQGAWEAAWSTRPRLRGWLHAGALPVALVATTALTLRRQRHRSAVAVYGAGLCAMLATSAGYHRLTRTEAQFRWAQPADHVMIFAAIAGTATPVATSVLPPEAVRPAVAALWVGAAAGAFARVVDLRRGTVVGHVASLALGWSGLALLPRVVRRHGPGVGALLAGGGISYTLGAALFAARRPNPFPGIFGYHEVWHTATLVGAAFHLAAIAEITRDEHAGDLTTGVATIEPSPGASDGERLRSGAEGGHADIHPAAGEVDRPGVGEGDGQQPVVGCDTA